MKLRDKMGFDKDPLFLIDGSAFIYRGFYANRHLRRSDGFPTNSLLLVTRLMLKILRQEAPRHMLFCVDGKGKNFRHEIYPQYKANRPPMPEELAMQISPILAMIRALGIPVKVAENCEADDCMASLAARFSPQLPVVLVSGDKDLKQCLSDRAIMWDPASKDEKILTASEFEAETGVIPAHWPDVQALIGDTADNIPGVPGIGPKTALQIFEKCPTLEDIRDHLDWLPQKLQAKLQPCLEEMFRWRSLTTLRTDACADLNLADLQVPAPDVALGTALANEYEMASISKELLRLDEKPELLESPKAEDAPPAPIAPPLPKLSEPRELPPCDGKEVAVLRLPPDGKAAICLSTEQGPMAFQWHGKLSDLCRWLSQASTIIVPDLKELMRGSESFQKLAEKLGPVRFFDLGLAVYLLDPEAGDYSWPRLAAMWRGETGDSSDSDPALALGMGSGLREKLRSNGLYPLFRNVEMPLVPVLAQMEERGVTLDPAAFSAFLDEVNAKLDELTGEIYAATGCEFNIRSARQLGEILSEKLGINSGKKTRTGQISTSQASLEKLAGSNPIVDTVLEYRKLAKLQATYLEPLPRLMDIHDRVHTTFDQKATATGRISSSNPNLQNIPVRGGEGKRMRACFVAPPGQLLIAADYSQIELRVLAHLSGDETLLRAFRSGEDIHTHTATLIFQAEAGGITPDQRRMAKTINFGLLYGMGARKLAQELKISEKQAVEFIERYFAGLGQLKNFYDGILKGAMENCFVTTMAGRIRRVEGINSANGQISSQARRQAVNAVIQGTAADIIKMAMISANADEKLISLKAKLVLQVHDELLLEAPEANAQEAAARIVEIMENVAPGGQRLSIPLAVDSGIGKNWAEAH